MTAFRPRAAVAAFILLVCTSPTVAAGDGEPSELAFLDGLTLVTLETTDIPSMHLARAVVQAHGGMVAIMSPPSLLIAWVPESSRAALAAEPGIGDVIAREVALEDVPASDPNSAAMVTFFNRAVRGEIRTNAAEARRAAANAVREFPPGGDVRESPPLDKGAYLENLRMNGIDESMLDEARVLGTLGNSDYMTGVVAVTIFFVESDGSGSDPDLYSWTPQHMQSYLDAVATGLAFWTNRAAVESDCPVSWMIFYRSGQDPRCQQWTEPMLYDDPPASTFISLIMANFGFTSGSFYSRSTAYNTWQLSAYQTNRAYSAFIVYNPPPSGSFRAYAYLYGPCTVLPFISSGWTKEQVFAHETGHIFGACDEYTGGCSSCGHCANGVDNGNCEVCAAIPRTCMMNANDWNLCSYTPGHVGFGIPAACTPPPPPPLPAPSVSASSPPDGLQGSPVTITVDGSNFFEGATLDLGEGLFVDVVTVNGANDEMTVEVTILNDAPLGVRDVKVVNRDGKNATLFDAFEVKPTLRHYYSATGGNVFPYTSPANAATSLAQAVAATYAGDTLFVETATFNNLSLSIDRGVVLHGGWNSNFTARDLISGKTTIDVNGTVFILNGADGAGLDGFIIENGTGSYDVDPPRHYGGGVRSFGADFTIANCEFRNNAAGEIGEPGVGGAVYAKDANVDIHDSVFETNSATIGGAIYLEDCSGSISDNDFIGNTVALLGSTNPEGGGVQLEGCFSLTLADNTFDTNTGATLGGGLRLDNSTTIAVTGGTFVGNTASNSGAGASLLASDVSFDGVTFDSNAAGIFGGGISSTVSTDVDVTECEFLGNTAGIGGGFYTDGGTADLRHNLLRANVATIATGGLYVTAIAGGEITGNTLDQNQCASGTGGMSIGNTAIEVFNNIVTNSIGHGIQCIGATTPILSHNLVWNSSGDDYAGCAPGTGAVSADPLFADPASSDYRFTLGSPAVDAGRLGASWDDPDGSRGDMGRYGSHAFTMDQPEYPKNADSDLSDGEATLSWSGNPEPDVTGYAIFCDSVAGFVPGTGNWLTTTPDTTWDLGVPADTAWYRVAAIDASGYSSGYSAEVMVTPDVGSGAGDPVAFRTGLMQNVPNPFNPSTRITYTLGSHGPVSLQVYDVAGRLVRRLVSASQEQGQYTVEWNGLNDRGERVGSGIYFYRLTASGESRTRKMVLLK